VERQRHLADHADDQPVHVINPLLGDYIDREAKASDIKLGEEIVAGVTVQALSTQVGKLPLIPEPFVPSSTGSSFGFPAPPTNYKNYFAAILTDSMVEMPYVHGGDGNPAPRIFQLGLVGGLLGQYVGVLFNSIVAKGVTGASVHSDNYTPINTSYAHSLVCIIRP
jgi:hypothetical protein